MATEGLLPFCAIYSTFLQRAYDQLIHDVAIQNLPVAFFLDRSGIVGQDGATHHGIYDIAYLRCIPNLIIFSPMNEAELRNIMFTIQKGISGPIAIRYPRGRATVTNWKQPFQKMEIGVAEELIKGNKIAVLSLGHIGNTVRKLIEELNFPGKIGHYNMRFAKPLDENMLHHIFNTYEQVITVENGCKIGGFGSAIIEFANSINNRIPISVFGIEDVFIEHGTVEQLHIEAHIDSLSIKKRIIELLAL